MNLQMDAARKPKVHHVHAPRFTSSSSSVLNLHERAETTSTPSRASSSSSTSSAEASTSCGANNNSALCEKPVSNQGLPIGLGVGIPLFLAVVVLIYLHYRHVRKLKKEDVSDKDFDAEIDMDEYLAQIPNSAVGKGNGPGDNDAINNSYANEKYVNYNDNGFNSFHNGNRMNSPRDQEMDNPFFPASPYILPPDTNDSKSSLESYSRSLHHFSTYEPSAYPSGTIRSSPRFPPPVVSMPGYDYSSDITRMSRHSTSRVSSLLSGESVRAQDLQHQGNHSVTGFPLLPLSSHTEYPVQNESEIGINKTEARGFTSHGSESEINKTEVAGFTSHGSSLNESTFEPHVNSDNNPETDGLQSHSQTPSISRSEFSFGEPNSPLRTAVNESYIEPDREEEMEEYSFDDSMMTTMNNDREMENVDNEKILENNYTEKAVEPEEYHEVSLDRSKTKQGADFDRVKSVYKEYLPTSTENTPELDSIAQYETPDSAVSAGSNDHSSRTPEVRFSYNRPESFITANEQSPVYENSMYSEDRTQSLSGRDGSETQFHPSSDIYYAPRVSEISNSLASNAEIRISRRSPADLASIETRPSNFDQIPYVNPHNSSPRMSSRSVTPFQELNNLPTPHKLGEHDSPISYAPQRRNKQPGSPTIPVYNPLYESNGSEGSLPSPHAFRQSVAVMSSLDFTPPKKFNNGSRSRTSSLTSSADVHSSSGSPMSPATASSERFGYAEDYEDSTRHYNKPWIRPPSELVPDVKESLEKLRPQMNMR